MLRNVFGPKREILTGDWTKLHNEELHNLCSRTYNFRMFKSRIIRCVVRIGKRRKADAALMGKSEEKTRLGRPRHRWEDNIKIHLRKEH
jgi:hypothetical protein